MNPRKYRWSRVYESAEEELLDFLMAKQITATRHHLESYDTQSVPAVSTLTHLWSAEGAAVVAVADQTFSLQPGDVLDIPAQSAYTITTSLSDFSWYASP
ncbi:MAG: hypothetical protein ACQR33_06615 [Candidatus Saccharibacteria bacterium]